MLTQKEMSWPCTSTVNKRKANMKAIKLFLLTLIALTSFGLTGCVSHTRERERVIVEPTPTDRTIYVTPPP